eukprot:CAMPEP_0180013824 /NCGR_PEP_ID=MMETSP0984-20121128/17772_1 /TAXON_ID=483367 /ORGANISM="non described non described, Strain CCMP 2436" /LENGTH=64 /DNA_ID=CAMNT_0021936303 /DNA_START=365 /DNA_END=559 /DNA_ORIENTATION=+
MCEAKPTSSYSPTPSSVGVACCAPPVLACSGVATWSDATALSSPPGPSPWLNSQSAARSTSSKN